MGKTIIESMYALTKKMEDPGKGPGIVISPVTTRKADAELRTLRKSLGMTTMQVLILTAIIQRSSRYRIDGDDVASFLGMDYLQFLTHDDDLDYLKKQGYIYIDKELHIHVPKEVLKSLKSNKAVAPDPIIGLSTGKILTRMKKLLSLRDDEQIDTEELDNSVMAILDSNPETSIARAIRKHAGDVFFTERVFLYGLIYRYWFEDDEVVGFHDVDDYLEEEELDDLRMEACTERLALQRNKVIEFSGYDGMLTKDYFKIRDDVKEEMLSDVGGMRKKATKISASRKLEASAIGPKELFYNADEGRQVAQLKELLSAERYDEIRGKMKRKGLRTGFTCLFYGGPGTGKTETVYQIARTSKRDLYIVDVSQVKSCWVGESEKNIKDVFDKYRQAVAAGGPVPILLFNEADAIFGIRAEGAERAVDKMENSIQNIILQEMEDLDGILMATTNLTTNLDKAFERRFLYKIRFDKPSLEARVAIWRSMIPELSEEEATQLAQDFNFSGGQIENIARKREVSSIIGLVEPSYTQIREFCTEEIIEDKTSRRKIGFNAA